MKCLHCNVEVTCKTYECPLCHAPLAYSEADHKEMQKLERAFPQRMKKRGPAVSPFSLISLILLANIFIISVTLNAVLTPKLYWSLIVVASVIYIYFFISRARIYPVAATKIIVAPEGRSKR